MSLRRCLFLLCLFGSFLGISGQESASLRLSPEGLDLGGGWSSGDLTLSTQLGLTDDEALLRLALEAPGFLAGPGSAAGALGLLAAPTGAGTGLVAAGFPLLASDLSGGKGAIGLRPAGTETASLFALSFEGTPGLVFRRAALVEAGVALPVQRLPRAAALGASLGLGPEGARLGLLGAAFSRVPAVPASWSADRPPARGGAGWLGGIILERGGDAGRNVFGLALSFEPRTGPGLAARLETKAAAGPLRASFRTGLAGPGFLALDGRVPASAFSAGLELFLALHPGFSLEGDASIEAAPPGDPEPGFSRALSGNAIISAGATRFSASLGGLRPRGESAAYSFGLDVTPREGRSFSAALTAGFAAPDDAASWELGMEADSGKAVPGGGPAFAASVELGGELRPLPGPPRMGLSFELELAVPAGRLTLRWDIVHAALRPGEDGSNSWSLVLEAGG